MRSPKTCSISNLCFAFVEEWDDVRLKAARAGVQHEISDNNVPRYLVLNIDQVWRQSLRFSKNVLMKGPLRCLALLPNSPAYFTSFFYIHICPLFLCHDASALDYALVWVQTLVYPCATKSLYMYPFLGRANILCHYAIQLAGPSKGRRSEGI